LVRENMGNTHNNLLQRKNFVAFIEEYDKRRGTNFSDTFPEYASFFQECKK